MEMKVWLDGYQRVVCGVTEQTTCQDIMIALAQASGKTGRFTMIEKWRTNERCLSPTDFPLLVLQKWGEYSNDVQLVLCHSRVGSSRKHRNTPSSGHLRATSNQPEHVPVKKSLTFSGAHRRASSTEQPVVTSNGRIEVSHSVESSEQGSVASQSSASLSPYMSLERQTPNAEQNLSNGDFEKDFRMQQIWSSDHLKQGSDDRTAYGKPRMDRNSNADSPVPVVSSRPKAPPVPSVRSSKTGFSEVGRPAAATRKEVLASECKLQNGSSVSEAESFRIVSNSSVSSNTPNAFDAFRAPTSRAPTYSRGSSVSSDVSSDVSSNVSSKVPTARDTNDNLVTDSVPKPRPLQVPAVFKQSNFSRSYEHQNGPSRETENSSQPRQLSGSEHGIIKERPVAAKRNRPVAGNSEGVVPQRTDSPPRSDVTRGVETALMSKPSVKLAVTSTLASSAEAPLASRPAVKWAPVSTVTPSVGTQLTSKPEEKQAPISTSVEAPVTFRPAVKQVSISNVGPSVNASVSSRPGVKQAPISTVAPSIESPSTSRPPVKPAPISAAAHSVEAPVTSRPAVKPAPISAVAHSVEAPVTSRPGTKPAPISTVVPSVVTPVTSKPKVAPKGSGLGELDQLKEAKERKELIELIGRQEREMLICEARLKDLTSEISLLEGDLEVDEKELESQMHQIEKMEAVERQLEEELVELELVSWEDKLDLEQQKEKRTRTEILLLKSSIAKSEAEIQSFVRKIRSLTVRTEEATQELNRFLEEKKEKEQKEIEDLDSSLSRATKESETLESALRSLEEETSAADRSLSGKKEELASLECQLKKMNLELFIREHRESASTRRSRTPVLDRLGALSRPGSSRRVTRGHLSPSPLRLMTHSVDETDRPALGYIV